MVVTVTFITHSTHTAAVMKIGGHKAQPKSVSETKPNQEEMTEVKEEKK